MNLQQKFFLLLFLIFHISAAGQDKLITFSDSSLKKATSVYFTDNWKYHPGDNQIWSSPVFNDSTWENVNTELYKNRLPKSGWNGTGWFRFHFKIDSSLYNETLRLLLWSAGYQQIYLDGKYISNRSDWKHNVFIKFSPTPYHIFAVKFSNNDVEHFHNAGFMAGFNTGISNLENSSQDVINTIHRIILEQMFFTGFILAFGLLHFILFLYNKTFKENLIYSIFLFVFAASLFFDYQNNLAINAIEQLAILRIHRVIMPVSTIFILLSLYSMLKLKLPRIFWYLILIFATAGVLAFIKPVDNYNYILAVIVLMIIESFRVIFKAQFYKVKDAWIIAAGFFILFTFSAYDWLLDMNMINQIGNFNNGYPFGTIGLLTCMSIFLSKSFAESNTRLIQQEKIAREQEIEKKFLEAENKRKSLELEDARKLQLSILPKSFPEYPNLEVYAEMRTAAEVGGDYYDYHLSTDGTLTLTIGDATGHGIKAGIMVTLIKSLFDAMAHTFFIPDFFNHCTKTIKKMNLGNLYMGMTVMKIQDYRITLSAAGMPPILIYRKDKNFVEDIVLKGMPLGAHVSFQYQQIRINVNPGDIILLLTDGYIELFNKEREMLDLDSARAIFCEAASKHPEEIIPYLLKVSDEWLNGHPQADDITFMVVKFK